jgi:hypothetical protein
MRYEPMYGLRHGACSIDHNIQSHIAISFIYKPHRGVPLYLQPCPYCVSCTSACNTQQCKICIHREYFKRSGHFTYPDVQGKIIFKWILEKLINIKYSSLSLQGVKDLLNITLGSWVRIPLEALMSVCVYSVFVCK